MFVSGVSLSGDAICSAAPEEVHFSPKTGHKITEILGFSRRTWMNFHSSFCRRFLTPSLMFVPKEKFWKYVEHATSVLEQSVS